MIRNKYVAIVDDDERVRKGLAALMRAHGIETRTFASGADFLKALPFGAPSCLIADVNMPEMNGLELQRELVRRGHRIATVVMTGNYDKSIRDRCRALGAIACLPKPVESDTLLATLKSCWDAPSAPSLSVGTLTPP